jgi:diguanylate cyclase (GGDEF)-like protein
MMAPALPARKKRPLAFLRDSFHAILIWPLAALLLTALVWSMTLSKLADAEQALRSNGATEAAALSRTYAEQLSRSLEQIDQITLNLKYYWKSSAGALRLEEQLHEGLYPASALLYVTIVNRHGEIMTSTLTRKTSYTLADRDYFLTHQNHPSNALLISKPAIGRGSGKQIIRFSRRLNGPDGAFDGMVMVSVEPAYFSTFNLDAGLGKRGFLSLRMSDGVVLATETGAGLRSLSALFGSKPAFATANGVVSMEKAQFSDAHARIVAWHAVKNYPLLAVAALSEEDLLLPLTTMSREYWTLAVAITAGLLLFAMIGMFLSSRLAWRRSQALQAREASGIVSEGGSEGFFMWHALRDRDGVVIDFIIGDCNERGASLYGLQKGEMLQRKLSTVYVSRAYFERLMQTYLLAMETGFYEDDFLIGAESPMKITWLHRKITRSHTGLILTLRDISEHKAHEKALSSLANSDALTALPNRHWLMGYLPQAIARAHASHTTLALLFVDLDDFKNINDTMGHAAGDALLQAAAARLRAAIRPSDSVVRLGGDEFTIILEHAEHPPAAQQVSLRIIAALNAPFVLAGLGSHVVQASIGISIFPQDGADVETLLKHADIAMYAAKANGKAGYRFFEPHLAQQLIVRLNKEQALRAAIDEDQFELHYQPRVDTISGQLRSMEALVRWRHPQRGLVQPDEFIALAEETGLIARLGELVIEKACRQLALWQTKNLPLVPVSVNVSPRQFNHGNIADLFRWHMTRNGVAPALVEIELTESCMMGDYQAISEQLAALKALGIKLLIDDFGTGYSSLSQLQRLDFDILKIDKAFTSQLGKGKEGEVFFMAIISMAHVLNIGVVAEGVETLEQLHILQTLSCNEVQGYFVSRPLAADAMEALMQQRFLFPELPPGAG